MTRLTLAPICWIVCASVASAQFPGDWNTMGTDAQRSSWLKNDAKISLANLQKPGFELVWKMDLNSKPAEQVLTTPPVLLDFYIGYRGFRSLGFVGRGNDRVVAIDTDLGRLEWEKNFDVAKSSAAPSADCPGGMTAGVTREALGGYPPVTTPRGIGRGTPAKSGVGEPFEGAVTLKSTPPPRPAPPPPPKPVSTSRRQAQVINPFIPRIQWVHALSSDGRFHSLYVSNGEEPKAAKEFLPPNAHARGLMVVDRHAYVATVNGCGGVDNGVWSLDVESGKVNRWKAGASVAGGVGPAMGPDGTLYATAGSELAALEEGTLKLKTTYRLEDDEFSSSPLVFQFRDQDLVAAATSRGKLQVFDSAAPGKPILSSAAFSSPNYQTGALASWQDAAGTRWLLAPAGGESASQAGFSVSNGQVKNGAIVAWKVVRENGKMALQPGWVSRDMTSPLGPIVVNGVIFAVASGENRGGDPKISAAEKAERSTPAILYALDALTGKELWNSGKTITSYVTTGGLAAGGSRVYVAAQDGTEYVFGFPIEH